MTVYVNDIPVVLMAGMTVRHALISADLLAQLNSGVKVHDEWGNELGLDGALAHGMRIYI